MEDSQAIQEAELAFEREVGLTGIPSRVELVGNKQFLKFEVGREAPIYSFALHKTQNALSVDNPFKGALGLYPLGGSGFISSIEANVLLPLLTRSTRQVSEDIFSPGYSVPFVPFQRGEDHLLSQPATQIVRGRRGVGKSTLIRRAVHQLSQANTLIATIDMQGYSDLRGDELRRELLYDICSALEKSGKRFNGGQNQIEVSKLEGLMTVADQIINESVSIAKGQTLIKRALNSISSSTLKFQTFVFLDDFHLIPIEEQPDVLHVIHGALKGANGWLKIAGLSSLINPYSPSDKRGLQVPGDAQYISLDLTLENPEAALAHLKAILEQFLKAVGYSYSTRIIVESAFKRLAWATAGVPRDFLQMFGRSIEHAQRNRHATITVPDVNMAIGEFGQHKLDDVMKDARNEADILKRFLEKLEFTCLDENKVNGFLVRSDESKERDLVHALSDLRMVHLILQSITPYRAGKRYEAYILDYSMFTGFRRRLRIKEMVPSGSQFKASELRSLPKIENGFLD